MANYMRKPVDFQNEEQDWQEKLRTLSLDLGGTPGTVQKPGFKPQTESYTMSMPASREKNVTGIGEAVETRGPGLGTGPVGYEYSAQSTEPAEDGTGQDDAVAKAQQMLQEQMTGDTAGAQSWQQQLNDILNQILNRDKFRFDLNGEALYDQYKDQSMLMGQQAMMDTMGKAQAMTGGYGNSYAQAAGQQAYNSHLQQMGNVIPELYSLALSKYQSDGNDLLDRYAILKAERDYEDAQSGGSGGGGGYTEGPAPTPEGDEPVEEEAEEPENQESVPNYDTIAANVNIYIKNGASEKEIKAYLNSAYRAGYITYEQYQSLLKGYRPVDFGE